MLSQGLPMSLSGCLSPAGSDVGTGLEESGRLVSFNANTSLGDHMRITMKTRVAVRDKNPHRFQIVPLRDVAQVSQCQTDISSQVKVPHSSTGHLLCSPSRNVLSYSLSSPSATPPRWGKNAKENHNSGGRGTELNSLKSLGSLNRRKDSFLLSCPTLSSQKVDEENTVLDELNLNRPEPKYSTLNRKSGISLQLENSRAAAISSSLSENSPSTPSSGRLTHSASQSLHIESRYDTRCLKFTSLSNIPQSDYISSGSTSVSDKMGPLTDITNHSDREPELKAKFLSAAFASQKNDKQASNKRHAMYTPSLFLPYFKNLASSDDYSPLDRSVTGIEGGRRDHQFDHEKTIRQEFQVLGTHLDDQDAPRRILHDPFEILPSGSMDFLPIDSPLYHSSPKATSGDLSSDLCLAYDESFSAEQGVNHTLDPQSVGMVYPEIILHLFSEIDKAIETWSTPAP